MMRGSSTITPFPEEMSPPKSFGSLNNNLRGLKGMEETVEHLKMLLNQEEFYPPCKDYLSNANEHAAENAELVSEAWRRKLCEWCYEVVDHFGFDREVVSFALSYLDRSVQAKAALSQDKIGKRDFQLLAVTSLYVAIKLHGEREDPNTPRRKLRIDAFVELSRGFFQADVIEATERTLLDSLNWRVNPPTNLRFIASYLRLLPNLSLDNQVHSNYLGGIYDIARYLTELSVCVSTFSFTAKTSVIAYAAVLCANEAMESKHAIPYEFRVVMQNNIAEVSGLLPNDPEVLRIRQLLKDLCPDMFLSKDIPSELVLGDHSSSQDLEDIEDDESGKTSPVCVVDTPIIHESRKRTRSNPADPSDRRLRRSSF